MSNNTSTQMNNIMPIFDDKSRYCIRLANGQGWHISATEELAAWAERLADIMQLSFCEPNGYPKLIFIRKKSRKNQYEKFLRRPEEDVTEGLSRWGWSVRDIYGIRFWSRPDVTDVICEIERGDDNLDILMMRHSLYPIYQWAQDSGGLPLHAGLVERDGKGVLLAAPRNTGKSTCCHRIPKPWYALCDEETLIVRDDQIKYLAPPFPTWSDYLAGRPERTWNTQHHLPLFAIFFLKQAKADEVTPIGQGQAAVCVYRAALQVCYRNWLNLDREEIMMLKKKLFENACEVARSIPAFKLRVSLTGRFWEEIEKVLP